MRGRPFRFSGYREDCFIALLHQQRNNRFPTFFEKKPWNSCAMAYDLFCCFFSFFNFALSISNDDLNEFCDLIVFIT